MYVSLCANPILFKNISINKNIVSLIGIRYFPVLTPMKLPGHKRSDLGNTVAPGSMTKIHTLLGTPRFAVLMLVMKIS